MFIDPSLRGMQDRGHAVRRKVDGRGRMKSGRTLTKVYGCLCGFDLSVRVIRAAEGMHATRDAVMGPP